MSRNGAGSARWAHRRWTVESAPECAVPPTHRAAERRGAADMQRLRCPAARCPASDAGIGAPWAVSATNWARNATSLEPRSASRPGAHALGAASVAPDARRADVAPRLCTAQVPRTHSNCTGTDPSAVHGDLGSASRAASCKSVSRNDVAVLLLALFEPGQAAARIPLPIHMPPSTVPWNARDGAGCSPLLYRGRLR